MTYNIMATGKGTKRKSIDKTQHRKLHCYIRYDKYWKRKGGWIM